MISDTYAANTLFLAIFGELLGNKRRRTRTADRGQRRQFRRATKVGDLAIVHPGTARAASPAPFGHDVVADGAVVVMPTEGSSKAWSSRRVGLGVLPPAMRISLAGLYCHHRILTTRGPNRKISGGRGLCGACADEGGGNDDCGGKDD